MHTWNADDWIILVILIGCLLISFVPILTLCGLAVIRAWREGGGEGE